MSRNDADVARGACDIVGDSPEMRRIRERIARVAAADGTVLITGDQGVGKERLARAVHGRSPRAALPFAVVSGDAALEAVLDPVRLGRGPSPVGGADGGRRGGDERVEPGTLFLTDVAETNPAAQWALLRFLKERQFRRTGRGVGKTPPRIIAATTRHLAGMVDDGEFRGDLFHRLNVVGIHVPPLRARRADILPLARHFVKRFAAETGRRLEGFSRAAERVLEAHAWPGNVSELESVVERAVVFEPSDRVEVDSLEMSAAPSRRVRAAAPPPGESSAGDHLDDIPALPDSGFVLERHVRSLEREYLARALRQAGGVKVRAAGLLGMSFRSFRYYVKKYDLG